MASASEGNPIRAIRDRLTQAVKTGDVSSIVSLFGENAVFMAPNEPTLYGIQEVREWWEEYFAHFRVTELTETEFDVTLFDGWAVERMAYMVVIVPTKTGTEIADEGRWFSVWKRERDGAWRIQHAMANSIKPIGAGTSRFIARMIEGKE
jgi:uncharacterized protein (TIGR02246 family)